MTGIIERVARAIHGADWKDAIPSFADESWDESRASYMALARAAIEAMREPTERMLDASGEWSASRAQTRWRCMIQAALEGEG